MRRATFLVLCIAVAVGAAAGLIGPTKHPVFAQLSHSAVLQVNPGAITATMTCGWHFERTSTGYDDTPQNGLDWSSSGGWGVYWRSNGMLSGLDHTSLGSGTVTAEEVLCATVTVEVRDLASNVKGNVFYTHTILWSSKAAPNNTFNIDAALNNWDWLETQVGTTATTQSELDRGCSNSRDFATHLHQGASSQFSRHLPGEGNDRYPIATILHVDPSFSYNWSHVTDEDDYQNDIQWTVVP